MKKIVCLILTLCVFFNNCLVSFSDRIDVSNIITDNFVLENETVIFDEDFLNGAGSSANDWYVISLKCAGYEAEYTKYLDALTAYVMQKYETDSKLHPAKATEWHRIALAVEACGGNPTNLNGIDLFSDGIYYRDLNKQGINAYIWSLVCLGSGDFQEPSDAINTKKSIIDKIVSSQLSDGGFTLSGNSGDVDVTSMVVTALSNFNTDEYEVVSETIEKAVAFLSNMQDSDGGYSSYGVKNCESSCQVVIALCSVGINPKTDERFIKNGTSAYEYIYNFETDNGFKHIADGQTNYLATYQAILAISAYLSIGNGSVYNLYLSNSQLNSQNNALSNYDIEMIHKFSEKVCASDLQTLKRLAVSLENYSGDDKFVLETTVNLAISNVENLILQIDDLDRDILELSDSSFKFLYKSKFEELMSRYNKLSSEDKMLVENIDILQKTEAEINSQIRGLIISILALLLIIICVIYLWRTHRKKVDD